LSLSGSLSICQRLGEVVQTLPRSAHEFCFTALHAHLAYSLSQHDYADASDHLPLSKRQEALEALHAMFTVVDAAIGLSDGQASRMLSATLFQSIQMFHDALLTLPHPSGAHLQNSIAMMCERLYTKQYRVRATVAVPDVSQMSADCLLPMTLSYLLLRALETDTASSETGVSGSKDAIQGGKRGDIVRLQAMKQGLCAFDYDDESSDTIKQLLVRCMVHPLFLRHVEGRRFLSFVFVSLGGAADADGNRTNSEMMRMFHAAIKFQLPLAKQSLIAMYADVYVRAWRLCAEPTHAASGVTLSHLHAGPQQLASFESDIIQDLMHSCIHSAHPRTCAALQSLMTSAFHDPQAKKAPRVEEMLQRLYEPILWRALKSANPLVRRHALEVFIDVFPLVNPELNATGNKEKDQAAAASSAFGSNDELLQYQFTSLLTLLTDTDLGIRVLAVGGVCKILSAFWEMIPLAVCKGLVSRLTTELVKDASAGAAAVRVAVFRGLSYLLDNVLSHGYLKVVLPSLEVYLFDSAESVQLAFIDLLLVVKRLKGMKYYDLVDLESIMLALETTTSAKVTHKLLTLVLNSYFPSAKPMSSTLSRCFTLLRSHPRVCARAMLSLHEHTSTVSLEKRREFVASVWEKVVHLVQVQREQIMAAAPATASSSSSGERASKKSRSAAGPSASDAADPCFLTLPAELPLLEVLLASVVELVKNAQVEEEEESGDAEHEQLIRAFSNGGLSLLLSTVGSISASARLSIIHLSALLPSVCSPDLSSISLPHLLSLPLNAPEPEYGPILQCLAAWGRMDEVGREIAVSVKVAGERGVEIMSEKMDKEDRTEIIEKTRASMMRSAPKSAFSKSKSKKSSAASSSHDDEIPSDTMLHPLLALRYLSYLFAHEKTRTMVLAECVVWDSKAEQSADGDEKMQEEEQKSADPETPSPGKVVGWLSEILSTFAMYLLPSVKSFLDGTLESVEETLSPTEAAYQTFLTQAIQASLKIQLHVHARLKLLAQRANQLAVEEAEERARLQQQEEDKRRAAESGDLNDSGLSSTALLPIAPAVIRHLALFPAEFEEMCDFTSYVMMAGELWERVTGKYGRSAEREEEEQAEEKQEMETKGKKSKKAAPVVAKSSASNNSIATPADFLRSHLSFAAQFTTELLTLGYFHPQVTIRHMMAWMEHLRAQKEQDAVFLQEILPTLFKSLYHLTSLACTETTGFGLHSKDLFQGVGNGSSPESKEITWEAWCGYVRSVVGLATSSSELDGFLSTHTMVRSCVSELLRLIHSSGLPKKVQPKVMLVLIETVLDDAKYPQKALLPVEPLESVSTLSPWPLLLLSSLSKSPSSIFLLPSTVSHFASQLAVHQPRNEAALIGRFGTAVAGLADMAENVVKMEKSQ
jgi:hypothetical protein